MSLVLEETEIMEESVKLSKGNDENQQVRMNNLLINKEDNEEEAPIDFVDFGIEPTPTLQNVNKRKTVAPRNLPRKKRKCCECCNIL